MDKIIRCLYIPLLIVLLAGCAQEGQPEPQPTVPPPPDRQTATPPAPSGDMPADQEPSPAPAQATASPTQAPTEPAAPTATVTNSPTPLPTATATPLPPTEVPPTANTATATAATDDGPTTTANPTVPRPPSSAGSTADLVDRGLILDVSGVASMYAWAIEWPEPQEGLPLPAHLLMTFDNHEAAEFPAGNSPLFAIFPINTYLAVAKSAPGGQPAVEEQLDRLWQLVESDIERDGEPEGWMPLLPPPVTPLIDWSDFAQLDFVHGRGLRYLRLVGGKLAYTYMGLTDDGNYAVTLTWPLGIPNAPNLEDLDAMVASLALGEPTIESP